MVKAKELLVLEYFAVSGLPLRHYDLYKRFHAAMFDWPLPSRATLCNRVPVLLETWQRQLLASVKGKHFSLQFDGTTRFAELVGVIIRSHTDEMQPEQKCLDVKMLKTSYNGEKLFVLLLRAIQQLQAAGGLFVGGMFDRAAVNLKAMDMLQSCGEVEPFIASPCISHFLDTVGSKLKTTVLNPLVTGLAALFGRSAVARECFRKFSCADGRGPAFTPRTPGETRWYSWFEFVMQVGVRVVLSSTMSDQKNLGY